MNTWEEMNKVSDAQWLQGIVCFQNEMGRLFHHDEQALLRLRQGWHWDEAKGGWLDPDLCAKDRCEEVEYTPRHKVYARGAERDMLP